MKKVTYYYHLLNLLCLFGYIQMGQAQVASLEVKVQYMASDDLTWGVYARPTADIQSTVNNALIASGQVTLLMRNNEVDEPINIQSINGRWATRYIATKGPIEAPSMNYFTINLSTSGNPISLETNKEILLFTFQAANCPDTIGLIDNLTDPFAILPNSERSNPGMDLSLFDPNTGNTYSWKNNYAPFAFSCNDCDEDGIVDALEDTNGDGVFSPEVDVSNLCNSDNDELNTPPANALKGCITIQNVSFTSPSDCGEIDGSVTVEATHESGNTIQYSIDGGRVWHNTPTIGNLEAGVTYNLELRDNIGLCFESYGAIELDNPNCETDPCVKTPFTISNYPDQMICMGGSAQLNITEGNNYNWNPTEGLNATNVANPIATPIVTTTYTVTVTNDNGCTATDEITITVVNNPTANAGIDQSLCPNSTANLMATGGSAYQWSPAESLNNTAIANPIATPLSTTTYQVTVSDANGCTDTDEITIIISDNLTVSAGEDQLICPDEPVALNASGGNIYAWSPSEGLDNPNIGSPTATIDATTTYCVTVTDANGCTGKDCITLTLDEACSNTDNVGNGSGSGSTVDPCIIGPAVVGCPDKYMCPNDQVQLIVNGGIRWEWSPSTGLDDPTSSIPIASPSETTTYTVTGWDENGCSATDEVIVNVVTSGHCVATPTPCQNNELVEENEVCIAEGVATAEICLPFSLEEIGNYAISLASSAPVIIHGCDFQKYFGYQYNVLPNADQATTYRIKAWQINSVLQTGVVQSIEELSAWMQSVDPAGNWQLDPTRFSIVGGDLTTTYGDMMLVEESSATATTLRINTSHTPIGALIEADMLGKEREVLTIVELATGCIDQILITRCP